MIEFEKYIDKEITISGFAEKVRNIIHNKSIFHRRLVNAFPNIKERVQFAKWTIKEKIDKLKL